MGTRTLITGGAGFIGQHLAHRLLADGNEVRILDNFHPQIHGTNQSLPKNLASAVEVVHADIRDKDAISRAIKNIDAIVHLAAETGTGQSMYEIERYFSVNVQGTAALLDVLQNQSQTSDIGSIVVASSRAIYGEGSFECQTHGHVSPPARHPQHLAQGIFEPLCPHCGTAVTLQPTEESAPFMPMSVYALTKQVQEQAILMFAKTRGMNAFALRYQNVYGPGQSLKNPYTGILAVFSTLARHGKTIEVYEDGKESRDFVFIDDVVEATTRAVQYAKPFVGALNIGSGCATSVKKVAEEICAYFGNTSAIQISGAFRVGDIRHNKACIKRAADVLSYAPSVFFSDGIKRFLAWAQDQESGDPYAYARSVQELKTHGLLLNQ